MFYARANKIFKSHAIETLTIRIEIQVLFAEGRTLNRLLYEPRQFTRNH